MMIPIETFFLLVIETTNQVDVLEKGIMNLTDLLADLHHSHNVALENPG